MDCTIDAMPPCERIMPNYGWVMRLRCLRFSTTTSLDCLLNSEKPMLLRPGGHSPLISTEHSLLWQLKQGKATLQQPWATTHVHFTSHAAYAILYAEKIQDMVNTRDMSLPRGMQRGNASG